MSRFCFAGETITAKSLAIFHKNINRYILKGITSAILFLPRGNTPAILLFLPPPPPPPHPCPVGASKLLPLCVDLNSEGFHRPVKHTGYIYLKQAADCNGFHHKTSMLKTIPMQEYLVWSQVRQNGRNTLEYSNL